MSYRRQDGGDAAGRLADRLVDRFGAERVFIDVDAIEPGIGYVEAITHAVEACDVLVAVIGPGWLTATDNWLTATDKQRRRLNDPYDRVRVEVGTALARGVQVIPVLVGGAVMPSERDLPEDLAELARRNALPIRHESFRADAGQLVAVIERVLASAAPVAGTAEGAIPHTGSRSPDVPIPFDACDPSGTFVFVSYAHEDKTVAYPELLRIRSLGIRVWYDEGIEPGSEWPESIAEALYGAAAFVVLITPTAVASRNVKNEIGRAFSWGKPFLAIHLAQTNLSRGLEMQMGGVQAVMRWQMDEDSYARKLSKALASYRSRQ